MNIYYIKKYAFNVIVFLFLVLISYIAIVNNLDSDYKVYQLWYSELSFSNSHSCQGFEPFFCALGRLANFLGLGFSTFVFLIVLFMYMTYFQVIQQTVNILNEKVGEYELMINRLLVIFLLFIFVFFILKPEMASHLIRQFLAASLIIYAVFRGGLVLKFSLVLVAGFIHFSSFLLMIPLVFALYFSVFLKKKLDLFLFLFLLIFPLVGFALSYFTLDIIARIYSLLSYYEFSSVENREIYNIVYKINLYFFYSQDYYFEKFKFYGLYFGFLITSLFYYFLFYKNKERYRSVSSEIILLMSLLSFILFLGALTLFDSPNVAERFYLYGKVFLFFYGSFILMAYVKSCDFKV
jgi:hypothetical protein